MNTFYFSPLIYKTSIYFIGTGLNKRRKIGYLTTELHEEYTRNTIFSMTNTSVRLQSR